MALAAFFGLALFTAFLVTAFATFFLAAGLEAVAGFAFVALAGFDFLEAVRSVAPLVKHVHLHDNFGRVCSSLEKKQVELFALGRGDMHLPIGKGEIPVEEVFSALCDYSGLLIN